MAAAANNSNADSSPPAGEYLVVARRYRPQTFDELIGQEHVARALSNAIATNRVGHAYLFTGARGVGKTSAARILAKALNCERGPSPIPCNVCDICQSISAGGDVDVLEIDGASNRGIDEIRQLRQNVNIRPSRARFKIYIIDEVHMLTREAFNALLKTLEEPPEHVKFIFCTTEATKIPITILSRCQRFDFAGIQMPSIVDRLAQIVAAEGVTAEPAALAILARRAAGSMRDSQSLLEQLLSFGGAHITAADVHSMLGTAGEARMAALVQHLTDRDAQGALTDLDGALLEGVDVGQLLEQLLGYFRDTLVAVVGCNGDALLHTSASDLGRLADSGRQLGLQTILAIMQIIDHALSRLRYSTQGRTLAEMALVRIANLASLDELADLIAGLRDGTITESHSASATTPPRAPVADAKKKADPSNERIEPAPIAAARAPAIELDADSVEQIWKQALADLADLLADNAACCEAVALSGNDTLVVAFAAKYTSCKAFCERAEQRGRLQQALSAVAGGPVKVDFTLVADPPQSAAPRRVASQRERLAEMSEHPLVRRASQLFDARVIRIEQPASAPVSNGAGPVEGAAPEA